jgi:hypothetical protein
MLIDEGVDYSAVRGKGVLRRLFVFHCTENFEEGERSYL